jgi:signal transduction histidine kinase/CheY-like chemotaxis protein
MSTGILLIDDEDDFRNALTEALEADGFKINQAASVRQGLHLIDSLPDLKVIILDMAFPGSDGTVLLERLKKQSESYRVIVHTGRDDLLSEERAHALKVFAYLPKAAALHPGQKGGFVSVHYLKFAIEQAFKDIAVERLQKRMTAFKSLWEMINAHKKGDDVLEKVCQYALEHIDGYTCHIRRLDPRKGDYELVAYAGPHQVRSIFKNNKKLDELFSGEVARTGRARLCQRIQNEHDFRKFKRNLLQRPLFKAGREYLETIQSAYIVPIKTNLFEDDHQVDATLNISGIRKDFFTKEKKQLIQELLEPAKLALSKQRLLEKRDEILIDYTESNELLVEVGEKLERAQLNVLFSTVLKRISKIIKSEMISLFLYNESTQRIEKRAEFLGGEVHFDQSESYAPGECLTGSVYSTAEPLLINREPTRHSLYESRKEIDHLRVPSRQIKHYLAVPLITAGKVIGVVRSINKKSSYYDEEFPNVENSKTCLLPRGFSQDCKIILGIIASHLGVAINNSQLIGKLNAKVSQHDALAKVGQRISAKHGLETENLLELIVSETATVMNSAICMLFLKNTHGDGVVLKRCHGIPLAALSGASYRLGEANTGTVAQTGKPRYRAVGATPGKYDTKILAALRAKYKHPVKLTSFMIVPITIDNDSPLRRNRIIGVLKVINKMPPNLLFDKDDLSLFQTFASQISVALVMSERNRSLFRLVQGVGHEIENSVIQIPPNAQMASDELDLLVREMTNSGFVLKEERRESPKHLKEMIKNIQRAAREGADFARDLLGFSERQFRRRTTTDLNKLIESEIKRFVKEPPPSVINISEVNLRFELSKSSIRCSVYKNPFIRVIRNIVANAYQAMQDRPNNHLVIRTYVKGHNTNASRSIACIDFEDTGKGIEPEKLHQIFESDFSERKGGNGLGLWLVRLSLLRMDAAISVKSKVNKGTTFTIELPLIPN